MPSLPPTAWPALRVAVQTPLWQQGAGPEQRGAGGTGTRSRLSAGGTGTQSRLGTGGIRTQHRLVIAASYFSTRAGDASSPPLHHLLSVPPAPSAGACPPPSAAALCPPCCLRLAHTAQSPTARSPQPHSPSGAAAPPVRSWSSPEQLGVAGEPPACRLLLLRCRAGKVKSGRLGRPRRGLKRKPLHEGHPRSLVSSCCVQIFVFLM